MAAEEALKKLEEQLNCPICLDTYTDPKLLPCHHVFCQKCLVKLVIRDQQGQLVLTCPRCRQVTPVPPGGVAGFQAAFRISQLLEILENSKVASASVKGAERSDSSSLNPVRKASHCSEHPDKELELYCETCEKLICFHCAIKGGSHHTHDQELLDKAYEKYSKEIISSFEPMEKQLVTIGRAVAQLDTHSRKITDQEASLETNIHDTMRRLREILYTRETSLVDQLHQMTRDKLKKLAVQKNQLETTQAQLSSCLEFMKESLQTSNQEEVLKMKTTVVQQVKELTTTFQPSILKPSTTANTVFSASPDFSTECQNYGRLHSVSATGLELAIESNHPCLLLEGVLNPWGVVTISNGKIIVSEAEAHRIAVFSSSGERLQSFGRLGSDPGLFDTPYGVAVDAEGNILVIDCYNNRLQKFTAGGEFLMAVGTEGSGPLQFKEPKDLTFNPKNSKLYIVEDNKRVQILNSDLTFFATFGTHGGGEGEFDYPCGITCDSTGNVYVVDSGNHRVQIFTAEGRFIRTFGSFGYDRGQLNLPIGIAIHGEIVYVSEFSSHCISVFTCEGEFVTSFGRRGQGLGEFLFLANLAIKDELLYVCDRCNNRVQVFAI